ncbi:hypothetical protein RHODGE_RHODGE_01915 [Rhodoplanes serenus]|uniref:Uncharacterized protein n=1 Tax=Rhodoplanes serenus TaxID=200615 RepID=A0A3S4B0J2_9BRAD|nr:hypothetical protein [Rhodoplanes serenus]VCU08753.1 hypothetical protein RHODGE_RHODGE_01915 [Rhodoplanes serenus]
MAEPRDFERDARFDDPRGIQNPAFADRTTEPPMPDGRRGSSMWAWLAGAVAAVFIIAIVYGVSSKNPNDVAYDRNAPAATTGSSAGTSSGAAPPAGSGSSSVPGTNNPSSQRSADPAR